MVEEKILDYVKTTLKKGYPAKEIKKTLSEAGWPLEEVDKAFDIAQGRRPAEPPKPPEKPIPPETKKPEPAEPERPTPEKVAKPTLPEKLEYAEPEPTELPGQGQPEPAAEPSKPEPLPPGTAKKKARAGFAVSLIAGIIMIITSSANLLIGFMGFPYKDLEFLYTLGMQNLGIITIEESVITGTFLFPMGQALAVLAFVLGILVIVGSAFMRKPGRVSRGGKTVLICSILNLIAVWGLGILGILGAIIGVIGGVLGIPKK